MDDCKYYNKTNDLGPQINIQWPVPQTPAASLAPKSILKFGPQEEEIHGSPLSDLYIDRIPVVFPTPILPQPDETTSDSRSARVLWALAKNVVLATVRQHRRTTRQRFIELFLKQDTAQSGWEYQISSEPPTARELKELENISKSLSAWDLSNYTSLARWTNRRLVDFYG